MERPQLPVGIAPKLVDNGSMPAAPPHLYLLLMALPLLACAGAGASEEEEDLDRAGGYDVSGGLDALSDGATLVLPDPVTCLVDRPTDQTAPPPPLDACVPYGPDPILNTAGPVLPSQSQLGGLNPATGQVQAYAPGGWAKLQPGLQGVGHAEMRLLLRDTAAPIDQPLVMEVAREVWTTCLTRMAMAPSKVKLVPSPQAGWWQPASYMATVVPMPPWMACGRWALFRTFWRQPGAKSWQLAQVTVRLYLGAGAEPIPP